MSRIIQKSGEQSESDPFKFILSTKDMDRDGDIIEQDGWDLADFKKNPIALFAHNHSMPIGVWENVRVEAGKLVGQLKMAAKGTSRIVDEVRSLLEQRILKAVSVGFAVKEAEPLNEKEPWAGYRYTATKLLEASVVSVPSNQAALMQRAKSLSPETREFLLGSGVSAQKSSAAKPGVSALTTPRNEKTTGVSHMSLSKRIEALQKELDEERGTLSSLMEDTDGREITDDEQVQVEELSKDIEGKEKNLESLLKAEKALTKRKAAAPEAPAAKQHKAFAAAKTAKGGELMVKAAVAHVIGHIQKRSVNDVLDERYGSDERFEAIKMIAQNKAATTPATTFTSGWASELVSNDTRGWVADLEAVSIYGALAGMGTSIDFGSSNSVTVPSRNRAKPVSGSWVGENATIPVKQGGFTSITLNRFKTAVITTFTEELANVSNPAIEALLRDMIRMDSAEQIDADLLDVSAGVAGVRPGSILNGQPTAASAGDTLDNILTDVRFLMDTLSAVNAGRNAAFIMNPARSSGLALITNATGSFVFRDEVNNGSFMGYRLITSTNCPAATVILADAADFATASGAPEFRVSDQATLVMADDDGVAPTMADTNAVTVAGSLKVSDAAGTTPPTAVHSMFQQYSMALRSIYPISWAMMRAGTAPYLTAVSW